MLEAADVDRSKLVQELERTVTQKDKELDELQSVITDKSAEMGDLKDRFEACLVEKDREIAEFKEQLTLGGILQPTKVCLTRTAKCLVASVKYFNTTTICKIFVRMSNKVNQRPGDSGSPNVTLTILPLASGVCCPCSVSVCSRESVCVCCMGCHKG